MGTSDSKDLADEQLLTGATGSLGVHLLHRLSSNSSGNNGKIICLVRAADDASAHFRILQIVASRGLKIDENKVVALAADVTKEKLGLSASVYEGLVKTVETVIHVSDLPPYPSLADVQAAWPVHFASSLVSFEDQIRGMFELARHS